MKRSIIFTIALCLACVSRAQSLVSPEVHTDGTVTFRMKAPNAKAVQLHCEGVSATAMQKDTNGVWSLTTDVLEPDIYAYWFYVDGLRVIDPVNPLSKYCLLDIDSEVHVPG